MKKTLIRINSIFMLSVRKKIQLVFSSFFKTSQLGLACKTLVRLGSPNISSRASLLIGCKADESKSKMRAILTKHYLELDGFAIFPAAEVKIL